LRGGWILLAAGVLAGVGASPLAPAPVEADEEIIPLCVVRPSPGLTAKCRVLEVYDGDTLTVELRIPVRVRLLDCWAPELREPGGLESRDHLDDFAALKSGTLWIPWDDARRAGDVWSFDRVLGHVWIDGEVRSASQVQIEAGHATLEKQ